MQLPISSMGVSALKKTMSRTSIRRGVYVPVDPLVAAKGKKTFMVRAWVEEMVVLRQ